MESNSLLRDGKVDKIKFGFGCPWLKSIGKKYVIIRLFPL